MRPRTLLLFALAGLAGAAVVVLPALAAGTSEAKLEVNENCVELSWPCWASPGSGSRPQPARVVTIAVGGDVAFTDSSSTAANIAWTSSAPTCTSGVPVSPAAPATGWEGSCTFELPGTYKFESSTLFDDGPTNYTKYEVVVEGGGGGSTSTSMTTTTSPTTTTAPGMTTPSTTSPTAISEPTHGTTVEAQGAALQLAGTQRGASVHGSLVVPQGVSGGTLEVALFIPGAPLATAVHSRQVRVGRLVRSSVRAGSLSFSVALSAKGKALLHRRRHLALTVRITLREPSTDAAAVSLSRRVALRAR
jgi:hypothetical protein